MPAILLELIAMFSTGVGAWFGYKHIESNEKLKKQGLTQEQIDNMETTVFGVNLRKVAKILVPVLALLTIIKVINFINDLRK